MAIPNVGGAAAAAKGASGAANAAKGAEAAKSAGGAMKGVGNTGGALSNSQKGSTLGSLPKSGGLEEGSSSKGGLVDKAKNDLDNYHPGEQDNQNGGGAGAEGGEGAEQPPEKTQDQKNVENNKKALDAAAEIATQTKNPYAMAAGYAYKAANKLTGGKAGEKAGEIMNKANKFSPGGKQLQGLTNKLGESGATDAVGAVAGAKNGSGAEKAGAAMNAANSLKNGSDKGSGGSSSSSGSLLGGSSGGMGGLGSLMKPNWKIRLMLMGGGGGFFFILIVMMIICGDSNSGAYNSITRDYEAAISEQGGGEGGDETPGDGESGGQNPDDIPVGDLTSDALAKIVNMAKSQINILEGSAEWKKYGQSGPWCAAFVSWVLKTTGTYGYQSHSCASWMGHLKNANKWASVSSNYTPKAGDLVLFDWNHDGTPDHIGIVTSASGNTVYTIEGNTTDPTKSTKKDGVFGKTRNKSQIIGYGVM